MLIFLQSMFNNLTGSYSTGIDPEMQRDMDEQTKEQMRDSGWTEVEISKFFEEHK